MEGRFIKTYVMLFTQRKKIVQLFGSINLNLYISGIVRKTHLIAVNTRITLMP